MRQARPVVLLLVLVLLGVTIPRRGTGEEQSQEQQPAPSQAAQSTQKPRRAVVTLEGKLEDRPALVAEDFLVEAGKQKAPPTRIYNPEDLPTLIAIVLQDNQTTAFGAQLPALRDFILRQPPNTYVSLFYLTGQAIDNPIPFDRDLPKVATGLRAPKGTQQAAPPSPYDKVAQIVAFMDRLPDARKEVLLFSEGSDAMFPDATAVQNRNLARAAELAQQAGIPIWVVYSEALPPQSRLQGVEAETAGTITPRDDPSVTSGRTGPGMPGEPVAAGGLSASNPAEELFAGGRSLRYGVRAGLTFLDYLAERSGGKVFSSGKYAVDIRPFLEQFQQLLSQQFVLEFSGSEPPKKIKLNRKLSGVKLLAPKR